jgi:hypothetical protein
VPYITSKRRFAVAGTLLVLLAVILDPGRLAQTSLGASWFFSPARLADLRLALGVLGVCVAILPWLLGVLRPAVVIAPEESRLSRPVDFLFAIALVASAMSLVVRDDPMTKDTKFYLGESLDIAAHGGPLALVGRCFDGSWAEDNRHPFYLAAYPEAPGVCNDHTQFYQYNGGDAGFEHVGDYYGPPEGWVAPTS